MITTASSINLKSWKYLTGLKGTFKITNITDQVNEIDFNEVPSNFKKLFHNMVHIDIEPWFEPGGNGFNTDLPFNMIDNQFFILKYQDVYFFANNEGYSYPRYLIKLINYETN